MYWKLNIFDNIDEKPDLKLNIKYPNPHAVTSIKGQAVQCVQFYKYPVTITESKMIILSILS